MAAQTLAKRTAEFLVSEANGYRSRDDVTVATTPALLAGQVLGRITVGAAGLPLRNLATLATQPLAL